MRTLATMLLGLGLAAASYASSAQIADAVENRHLLEELVRDLGGVHRDLAAFPEPPSVIRVRVGDPYRVGTDLREHALAVLTEVAEETEPVVFEDERGVSRVRLGQLLDVAPGSVEADPHVAQSRIKERCNSGTSSFS